MVPAAFVFERWLFAFLAPAAFVTLVFTGIAASLVETPTADAASGSVSGAVDFFQDKQEEPRTPIYYGVQQCRGCHTKGYESKEPLVCRNTEVEIWEKFDKHVLAHKVLSGERAQRMGKLLRLKDDVTKNKDCLTCHSVWYPADLKLKPTVKAEEGVSCVACHGTDLVVLGSSDFDIKPGWVDNHWKFPEKWRKLDRATKQAKFGMTDLWDPVARTRVCASCHIGNAEQGKVVTHEMYAAGHPPLPDFEVASFSSQMPPHWQYLREKDKSILDLMKFQPSEVELEQTHLLAAGGLVSFQEYMRLLESRPAEWPEFANYSCYACHHDLKHESWRQRRGYPGKPGRPPMHEWPAALVELGLYHAASDAEKAKQLVREFHTYLAALQAAVDAEPFGNRAEIKNKAGKLYDWADVQVKQIQKRIKVAESEGGYRSKAAAQLLARLQEIHLESNPDAKGKPTVPDFDSARQQSWAFQLLYFDLQSASKADAKTPSKFAKAMLADPAWKGLNEYMRLTLPEGQKRLEDYIDEGQNRIREYEPKEFYKLFDAVLKKSKPGL